MRKLNKTETSHDMTYVREVTKLTIITLAYIDYFLSVIRIGLHGVVESSWILNPCVPGSNLGHRMIFFSFIYLFFFMFLSLLLQCKFANSALLSLLSFSYFITPHDAQASSAFSALILSSGPRLFSFET